MDCVKVIPQQSPSDCGVACIAMLLDISYEDAYVEVAKIDKRRSRNGLYMSQIKKAAAALGKTLSSKRNYDPEEVTGILAVEFENGLGHVVLLWKGVVIDTDATIWEYDTYLALNKVTPGSLLVLKD